MLKRKRIGILLLVIILQAVSVIYAEISSDSMEEKSRWIKAKFQSMPDKEGINQSGLLVLENHRHAVTKNKRGGKPFKIGNVIFSHGIACHAPSSILVRHKSPIRSFHAKIGIDNNEETHPGGGDVVFLLETANRTIFRSGLIKEGMDAVDIDVNLGNACEFKIKVDDGGSQDDFWDQADWADAYMITEGGEKLYLDELDFLENASGPYSVDVPFSFCYGGQKSQDILSDWECTRSQRILDEQRKEYTVCYLDPVTGLSVKCVAVEYLDFPTIEWVVYFKNNSNNNSPLISNVQALSAELLRYSKMQSYFLNYNIGDVGSVGSYQPLRVEVGRKNESMSFNPGPGGRSSDQIMPYFNLEGHDRGVILAIGWPGQWKVDFSYVRDKGVVINAGQQLTHFRLYPGEEIRTPLIVLQLWEGEAIDAQNKWRQWMLEYNIPRNAGQLPKAQCTAGSYTVTRNGDIKAIECYSEKKIQFDNWGIDAGWYDKQGSKKWEITGTWQVDKIKYPNGIKDVSDCAHRNNMNLSLWFEPERVMPGTWLYNNHPEWLFEEGLDWPQYGAKLLNLGDPNALNWLIEYSDKMIKEEGIDIYRLDFNANPLRPWQKNDLPDRVGISEIRYVEGFLRFLDELRWRNPKLVIDNCSSGGRRNDIETMRRGMPFWRSDYIEPVGKQCHTYGLSSWLPYQGTAAPPEKLYSFRSGMDVIIAAGLDTNQQEIDWDMVQCNIEQWKDVSEYYLGDFYPLSSYSTGEDSWMAWQFNRPDVNAGVLQAFRRNDCPVEKLMLKVKGLDSDVVYSVVNFDSDEMVKMTGKELMEKGVYIAFDSRPDAVLIKYQKEE